MQNFWFSLERSTTFRTTLQEGPLLFSWLWINATALRKFRLFFIPIQSRAAGRSSGVRVFLALRKHRQLPRIRSRRVLAIAAGANVAPFVGNSHPRRSRPGKSAEQIEGWKDRGLTSVEVFR